MTPSRFSLSSLRRNGLLLAALTTAAPGAYVASAQTNGGTGNLTGTVSDVQGGLLQGAQVLVTPGNVTAVTNAQGTYSILGLPAGSYTVTATYLGFQPATNPTQIAAGQTARLDEKLAVTSNTQQVEVYAGRQGGEIEAINRTFNADNIINVLPADVITSLPNANVADAIGRLPSVTLERDEGEGKYVQVRGTEPRLTHTTLDGVTIASPESVRQIKLDLIPADLVESVQINKTLQANMEGDGIGGSVDLRTKSAEDRPTIYVESLGGYTPIIGGRSQYQFDGTLGKRFLGKKLGLLGGGSYDWNGRGINDIEPAPALSGTYDLRDYRYFRDRRGFAGTADYRFSDTSSIYLKGLYSHFNNFGDDWIYSPTINTFVTATQGDVDGTTSFQALRRRPVQDIGGLQLGGNHVVRRALFHWDTNASVARTRDDGYSFAHFAPIAAANPLNNVVYGLDVSKPLTPHLNVQNGANIFDTNQYFYQNQQIQKFYNPEVDLGFGASLAIPYTLGGHSNNFEFGGRFRNEHKFVNQDTRTYYPNGVTFDEKGNAVYFESDRTRLSKFLNDFTDPNYYQKTYQFGAGANPAAVTALSGQFDGGDVGGDSIGNSFNQREKVTAGYVMNTSDLGRFRVVLGLRIEATNENNLGYIGASRATTPGTTPVVAKGSYIDLLPSASVRYALTPTQGIRLVYGRGLSRPNFSDLIPFQSAPSGGNARDTVSLGNPNLKSEYADNIDLLYENALPRSGLLQAGFFYKNFSNPIVGTTTYHAPDAFISQGPYFVSQTINAGSAYVYGFEISFQQHFTYLPGLLSGFGISTNYGYTDSQATLPPYVDVKATPAPPVGTISGPNRGPGGNIVPLLRQSPNTYNFSPTYDRKNLSLRLGMAYNQAEIFNYNYNDGKDSGPIVAGGHGGGLHGPNGDQYLYSHLQVDLQGTYKLPKGFTAVAYGLNLNNEVFGFYQGDPNYPIQREFYRQTFGGGLRWSPNRER